MILRYLNTLSARFFILLIKIYQLTFSLLLRSNCRYLPTCSEYAIAALKKHGLITGMYYSIKRIFSCHPFGGQGYDPVPKKSIKDS